MRGDPDVHCPTGQRLKAWLFGGASISTTVALFDLDSHAGQIVSDLFGDERYFADADTFWVAQNATVATRRAEYLDAGWSAVEVIGPAERFHHWEYVKIGKRKGGRVYIELSPRGEVVFHEGYMSRREALRIAKDKIPTEVRPARPELTATLQTYVDLHRHAAVRAVLTAHSGVALRLMVAHAINGSALWHVRTEPQRAGNDAVAASLAASVSEVAFDTKRREVLALLAGDADRTTVNGGNGDERRTAEVFARLLTLSDEEVVAVLAIVMGETLSAGSPVIDAVGVHLGVDMAGVWQADDVFFALLRDRQVLTAMLA
jgi:ParB family chromosome partitioning protein